MRVMIMTHFIRLLATRFALVPKARLATFLDQEPHDCEGCNAFNPRRADNPLSGDGLVGLLKERKPPLRLQPDPQIQQGCRSEAPLQRTRRHHCDLGRGAPHAIGAACAQHAPRLAARGFHRLHWNAAVQAGRVMATVTRPWSSWLTGTACECPNWLTYAGSRLANGAVRLSGRAGERSRTSSAGCTLDPHLPCRRITRPTRLRVP
jgi:hypothetical protein